MIGRGIIALSWSHFKSRHHFAQLVRLDLEGAGSGGTFFAHGCVLLRHAVDGPDRFVDMPYPAFLIRCRTHNALDQP